MKKLIIIAWRNLWRNKKRTIITTLSIFMAVLLSLFMRSMQKGAYSGMIKSVVKLSTGYIQIHGKGYWEEKSINKSMLYDKELLNKVSSIDAVSMAIPRLESFALASYGKKSKGVLVEGIDPEKENQNTRLNEKIIKGKYLEYSDNGVLVASKLAKYLNIDVGDTLVLIGQGYHGVSANGIFRVKGIIKHPLPELNNKLVYMNLNTAASFYAAYNRLTSISIMLKNEEALDETLEKVEEICDSKFEVMRWDELNKEVVQAIKSDNAGGIFMLAILYVVIAFGVFGTMVMMTMERRKEFAVMIAVGMRKSKLMFVVLVETILLGFTGIITGTLAATPILYYLKINPIKFTGDLAEAYEKFGLEPVLSFSLNHEIFINQALTVAIITLVASIYPLFIINKFDVLKGMRS